MSVGRNLVSLLTILVIAVGPFSGALADEGMWTYDNLPLALIRDRYGFEPTQEWLDHVRLSSARMGGGSAAFVSPNGLLVTNHHVGRGQVQALSTRERDYVKQGFYARTLAEELKCPTAEIVVLVSMQDVTLKVTGAVKEGMTEKQALDARNAAIARLTQESQEKTGLRSDVVSLYQGGEYWLYQYKRYTDIRLVMAPEMQIAFYGGDPDNFTYPRWDLDVTFFRVYEDGKPLKTDHYLKWNAGGAKDGELVFVSGHPGSTNRLHTMAQLEYARDVTYPLRLDVSRRRLEVLKTYADRGPEEARRASNGIFGIENGIKVTGGEYKGLKDPDLIAKKAQQEHEMRAMVDLREDWKELYGWAWDTVIAVIPRLKARAKEDTYRALSSTLFSHARTIVQYHEEVKKPNGERLSPYQDANIAVTKFRLLSKAPVYADLEEAQLAGSIALALEKLGPQDPYVLAVLGVGGKAPDAVARDLVGGTKLADVEYRKKLFEGGAAEVNSSRDPMILLARTLYPIAEANRTWYEANVSAKLARAGEALAQARFAVYGKSLYPDATGTLRLSFGTVKGYPMNGTVAPSKTTMYGLYDRYYSFDGMPPFDLPQRFLEARPRLDLSTPVNMVTTNDITGGNSGSPIVNRKAEFVGLVFDGNIESHPGRFIFDETANRCVAVHPAAITECLRKVYDAGPLADELQEFGARAD